MDMQRTHDDARGCASGHAHRAGARAVSPRSSASASAADRRSSTSGSSRPSSSAASRSDTCPASLVCLHMGSSRVAPCCVAFQTGTPVCLTDWYACMLDRLVRLYAWQIGAPVCLTAWCACMLDSLVRLYA